VDERAIAFLKGNNHGFNSFVSDYNPPLPFDNGYFDAIYAFSVFTHLPAKVEENWLRELARITKPGSVLILSSCGEICLKHHHSKGGYKEVNWDMLTKKGFVFIENPNHKKNPSLWPGVTASYGLSFHHPGYIEKEWGKIFSKVEVIEAVPSGGQDIVVCTR